MISTHYRIRLINEGLNFNFLFFFPFIFFFIIFFCFFCCLFFSWRIVFSKLHLTSTIMEKEINYSVQKKFSIKILCLLLWFFFFFYAKTCFGFLIFFLYTSLSQELFKRIIALWTCIRIFEIVFQDLVCFPWSSKSLVILKFIQGSQTKTSHALSISFSFD